MSYHRNEFLVLLAELSKAADAAVIATKRPRHKEARRAKPRACEGPKTGRLRMLGKSESRQFAFQEVLTIESLLGTASHRDSQSSDSTRALAI
ncbi:MAG: hypothetical protein ACTS8S_02350 [Giesbergeria sp.]